MSLKKNIFLTWALNALQTQVAHRNKNAREMVQQQIEQVANKSEMTTPITGHSRLDKTSQPLQPHIMKSAMILCFYCSDKNAKRLKGLKSVTGNEMVTEDKTPEGIKEVHIWNEETKQRDVYEEVYSSLDPNSGAQFSAYIDKTNNRLTFNFGGTNFASPKDGKSAIQTMTGSVDMRMTQVLDNVNNAMAVFKERYPGVEMPVDIVGHSSGANAIALANYYLRREHGVEPRSQIAFDPFGMKNSFNHVANMIAKAEGRDPEEVLKELSHNTFSYKVEKTTFIDKLNYFDRYNHSGPANVEEAVGTTEHLKIQGSMLTAHMGKAFIMGLNTMEFERINPALLEGADSFEMAKSAFKA